MGVLEPLNSGPTTTPSAAQKSERCTSLRTPASTLCTDSRYIDAVTEYEQENFPGTSQCVQVEHSASTPANNTSQPAPRCVVVLTEKPPEAPTVEFGIVKLGATQVVRITLKNPLLRSQVLDR